MSHSREVSNDSSISAGSAYKLILEHVLSFPGSYELPLRTMYTLNCLSRTSPLPQHLSRPSTPHRSPSPSPTSLKFPDITPAQAATAQFTSSLFSQVSRLPTQPCSLPPVFINSFVRRCFPVDLDFVDFTQALTGLDYLKDLETRRRREGAAAFHRLNVEREQLHADREVLLKSVHPAIAKWVDDTEKSETKIEALYTQVYVALRRWILINELSATPFNKHNCLAMLNTLYPPTSISRPTTKLTPEILKRQRDTFFRYIQAVERRGPNVLQPLKEQNTNPGDENGWPRVRQVLDSYLRVATALIEECMAITDGDALIAITTGQQNWSRRQDKKADSGVSFGSAEARVAVEGDDRKRSPDENFTSEEPLPPAKKHYSTIERIARELRRLRSKRVAQAAPSPEAMDIDKTAAEPQAPEQKQMHKTIRRLRSLGDLRSVSRAGAGRGDVPVPSVPAVSQSFG